MENCSVELYHSLFDLPCSFRHALIWISQHQVLLSGAAASVAAYWTIKRINSQIQLQAHHREKDDEKELKANLNAFAFKNTLYIDEISRMNLHVEVLKYNHKEVSAEEFYLIFQPILFEGIKIPDLTDKDSYILSMVGKADLMNDAMIALRYAKGLRQQFIHYAKVCKKLEEVSKGVIELNAVGEKLVASFDFDVKENPEIVPLLKQKKHNAELIISQIAAGMNFLQQYLPKLNPVLKEYGVAGFEIVKFEPSGLNDSFI